MGLLQADAPVLGSAAFRKNFLINGGMAVAQRGDTVGGAADRYGGCDRMTTGILGYTAGTIAQFVSTGDPVSGWAHGVSPLSFVNGYVSFANRIEAKDSIYLDRKTVTFSCRVYQIIMAGCPVSVALYKPQSNSDDWTGAPVSIASKQFTVPLGVWTDIEFTYTFAANDTIKGTMIRVFIGDGNQSPSGVSVFTGVWQLEIGSVKTPFEFRPYSEELALCQRYYEIGSINWTGYANASAAFGSLHQFRTRKRGTPTVVVTVTSSTNSLNPGAIVVVGTDGFMNDAAAIASGTAQVIGTWTAEAEL
jgi:hypothetical protein